MSTRKFKENSVSPIWQKLTFYHQPCVPVVAYRLPDVAKVLYKVDGLADGHPANSCLILSSLIKYFWKLFPLQGMFWIFKNIRY